jgi:hypothetical protein
MYLDVFAERTGYEKVRASGKTSEMHITSWLLPLVSRELLILPLTKYLNSSDLASSVNCTVIQDVPNLFCDDRLIMLKPQSMVYPSNTPIWVNCHTIHRVAIP